MKKLAILALMLFFVVSAMPVVFGQEVKSTPKDWLTIFQRAKADIHREIKMPSVKEINWFEESKAYVATWKEEIARAKNLSLRGNKEEIARRRGIK